MNNEDKEFHIDLANQNKESDIKLAKIGMSFGGLVALGAALFALGGEELLQLDFKKVVAD